MAGGVSVLSQSGGLTGDVLQAGHRAGLGFAHLASIGNAVDVTAAELLDWLVDDPQTAGRSASTWRASPDGARLIAGAAPGGRAQARRSPGRRHQRAGIAGSRSHTGAMATDARIWKAIAARLA